MPASIYRSPEGQAEILGLYHEALSRLGINHKSKTVSTRCGETHVLSLGPEDAPPEVFLHGGNFLNPTCLRWFLPIAQRHRIHAPDIVGQPGKSAQLRPSPKEPSPRPRPGQVPPRPYSPSCLVRWLLRS
jgi:pimeloyl-ACP methyl ester carboxylesterase